MATRSEQEHSTIRGADASPAGGRVSAAEFVRGFAKWKESAVRNPVYVTTHGRDSHVLLAADAFERLLQNDGSAAPTGMARYESIFSLADWVNESVVMCDKDLNVVFVNRAARAQCRMCRKFDKPEPLRDVMPEIEGSLMQMHIRRTLSTNEANSADIPSPFRDDAYLHFHCFPFEDLNVLMFRDITEEVRHHRLADVKAAMLETMKVHGGIGYVRLNLRGTIERTDNAIAEWIGLPQERMLGASLPDLVAVRDRPAFREAIENAIAGQGNARISVNLMSNHDSKESEIAVICGLSHLQGGYGAEGAILMFTRTDS